MSRTFAPGGAEHHEWQVRGPYVGAREKDLVELAFLPLGSRVLDVGCGRGATLEHLGRPAGAVGIDVDPERIALARENLPGMELTVGSAEALPFEGGRFDHVIIRDVLHHLDDPARALEECRRVLEPGGRLDVLEPCRNNPLVLAHALTAPGERGELRSTPGRLLELIGASFEVEALHRHQALPLHRLVFHPSLGWPEAPLSMVPRRLVATIERLAERVMPEALFAYIHVRARRGG